MADPRANMKVKIGGDIAEIKSALTELRGDLAKVKRESASTNVNGLVSGLKGLAGSVIGVGSIAVALKAVFTATVAAEKAQAQLNAVLKSTGGSAGLSASELNKMAEGLQAVTTYDDEAITGAQSLLLTFTKIGREVFPEATKAVLNMSTALGQDLQSSAMLIGKALNDPIKGVTALTRSGIQFTAAQKDMIKEMVETGRVAEAQAIILKELEVQFGGSAEAARNTLGGALQGLKNDFDNLLEGDAGDAGVRGATDAINELGRTMRSEEVKTGFASVVTGLIGLVEWTAKGIAAFGGLGLAIKDALSADQNKTYQGLLTKRWNIEDDIGKLQGGLFSKASMVAGGSSGEVNPLKGVDANIAALQKKLADIDQRINAMRTGGRQAALAAEIAGNVNLPPMPKGAAEETEEQRRERERKAKEALAAAKKAAADRVSAEKKAAEEIKRILDQEAEDARERDQRIAEGLAEANVDLLRRAGKTAEAAALEIDAKYAKLLADLRLKGDTEGEATIRKLIGIEKADAVLSELRGKVQQVMDDLRGETEYINNQVGIPGGITATEAEAQLQAARERSLAQLIKLRDAAQQAYNQSPSAETLAALREADGAVKQLQASTNDFNQRVKDGAVNALTGFFTDLATGAKSFKDAFKDMVRNFVQGIAQMIAQKLALKAVDAITTAFGFHAGGMVGAGGSFRRQVNPMIFSGAPRFHTGGMVGDVRRDEVPAILLKGERVLNREETKRYNSGQRPSPGTRIVNVMDPSLVTDAMASSDGEKVILNVIASNPSKIKQMLT